MPQQRNLTWADATMQKGLVILRQQARAGSAPAKQVLGLLVRMDDLQVLETKSRIPARESARGMIRTQIRDVLINVGRNGGLPARGSGSRVIPNFWGRMEELRVFTSKRSREIKAVPRAKPRATKRPKPVRRRKAA